MGESCEPTSTISHPLHPDKLQIKLKCEHQLTESRERGEREREREREREKERKREKESGLPSSVDVDGCMININDSMSSQSCRIMLRATDLSIFFSLISRVMALISSMNTRCLMHWD